MMKTTLGFAISCFVVAFYVPLLSLALRPLGFSGGLVALFSSGLWLLFGLAMLRKWSMEE